MSFPLVSAREPRLAGLPASALPGSCEGRLRFFSAGVMFSGPCTLAVGGKSRVAIADNGSTVRVVPRVAVQ